MQCLYVAEFEIKNKIHIYQTKLQRHIYLHLAINMS